MTEDVESEPHVVTIVAIGYKDRNKLFFRGEEFKT